MGGSFLLRARLLTLASLFLTASGGLSAQAPQDDASNLYRVRSVQMRPTVTLGGTVVPEREVTLAAEVPGRVNYIAGEEGDEFEEETVLLALDEEELRAQETAAIAALRDADAQIRNAGVMYNREIWNPQSSPTSKAPGGMGIPSAFDQFFMSGVQNMLGYQRPWVDRYADLYGFGTRVEQARNSYLRAQSQLKQIQAKIRDSRSIAPFNGMIIRKLVEEGDTVQPGQPLLEFADTSVLQIEVDIPARLMYRGLREGHRVSARLDVGFKRVPVRVAQIYPMADPQRHTVKVKFELPPDSPAAPGMYAEVMVPDPTAPVRSMLVIPTAAIIQRGSLPMVKVAIEEGREELRLVRLGEQLDRDYVSVLSGLKPDELIHVNPQGGKSL